MYVSILHLRSHLQTKPFNKELDFSFFQITNGHHSVEGYRGGRHGFQTTECSSLSTWVRNPSHLVNLFTSDRPPYCLLLSLLWVPGWGFKRGSSPLWLPRSHRWSKSNFVQIQRRGDSCQQIVNFKNTSFKYSLAKMKTKERSWTFSIESNIFV